LCALLLPLLSSSFAVNILVSRAVLVVEDWCALISLLANRVHSYNREIKLVKLEKEGTSKPAIRSSVTLLLL
jgi:hypothetical protein